MIARETGDFAGSEEHLGRAWAISQQRHELVLAAHTARELAELFRRQDRNRDTLRELNTAHRLYSQLRARRDVVETRRRLGELEAKFLEIVRDWGASIESKDDYTSGHCDRVADFACALARLAGLEHDTLFWFRAGALLHDAGKLIVPSSILNKPGPLTAEERALMERHPAAGEKMLAGIEFPWDVKPMIRHHHERWDGAGYPDRLAGEAIPLSARILCLADVWDALITDRPYRPRVLARRRRARSWKRRWGRRSTRGSSSSSAGSWSSAPARRGRRRSRRRPRPRRRRAWPYERAPDPGPDHRRQRAGVAPAARRGRRTGGTPIRLHARRAGVATRSGASPTSKFNAVLLDLSLTDGHDLAPLQLLHDQHPEMPIIVLSSVDDEALAMRALKAGAQDSLVKGQVDGAPARARDPLRDRAPAAARGAARDVAHRSGDAPLQPPRADHARAAALQGGRPDAQEGLAHLRRPRRPEGDQRQLGHRVGDAALLETTELLKETFRDSDIMARIGGDEFVVLAMENAGADAEMWTARLQENLRGRNARRDRPYLLSLSIGIAYYDPDAPRELDDLLARADGLMYEEKRAKRLSPVVRRHAPDAVAALPGDARLARRLTAARA